MKFGMPTLIETETLEQCAALCARLGLDFIEINMNLPQYQTADLDAAYFRSVARDYGISYTVHLDENLNVSDFNPMVAEAYTRTALDTIAWAQRMEVPVLNMHMLRGVYFTLPDRKVYLFDRYEDRYMRAMAAFRDACEKAIGTGGTKICVENWSGYTGFQIKALDLLLESPVFGLTYDVGHNHCNGKTDEPIILAREEKLCHMHLHDAAGTRDHQALGTGELDVLRYLNLAHAHDCTVLLETKTAAGLEESVSWIDRNWRKRK